MNLSQDFGYSCIKTYKTPSNLGERTLSASFINSNNKINITTIKTVWD